MLGYEQDEDDLAGLQICKQQYRKGTMLSSNASLSIDSTIETGILIIINSIELLNQIINSLKLLTVFNSCLFALRVVS